MLRSWVKRKHVRFTPAVYKKYWLQKNGRKTFGYWETQKNGKQKLITLKTHAEVYNGYSLVSYVKVRSDASVFDGNTEYWSKRAIIGKETRTRKILIRKQAYKFAICEDKFYPSDVLEVDHITPTKTGGSNDITNLRLVHGHCHDQREN